MPSSRPARALPPLLAAVVVLVLAGCGAAPAGPVASTAAVPVPIPSATASPSTAEDLIGWPGAAGQVVDCDGPVVGTTRGAPYDGEDVGATPDDALAAARRWASWDGAQDGFVLAGSEADRRLYVLDVAGVAKQALILRHGPALKGDGTRDTVVRWWLESWARCDYAELPDAVARAAGLQIWTDGAGTRRPTSEIVSFEFTADCFPGMTALDVDGPVVGGRNEVKRNPVEYVRRPSPELRKEYFHVDFVEHVAVPTDAVDSGFARDGAHLWFSADRATAYVGARDDAEAWPRARLPIRCA